jgi:hypothetical protein
MPDNQPQGRYACAEQHVAVFLAMPWPMEIKMRQFSTVPRQPMSSSYARRTAGRSLALANAALGCMVALLTAPALFFLLTNLSQMLNAFSVAF